MFGFQPKYETSKIVYMPIPWETTTSYGGGTSRGPEAIIKASRQIDERDPVLKGVFEQGLFMMPENPEIKSWQNQAISSNSKEVANSMGAKLNELVFQETEKLFSEKKIPGLVGGDHSIAFGGIKAASRHFKKNFGLLHFDAHLDFRKAYQGYTWSHASILFNIMENCDAVSKLIQVGTRDFCDEEITYLESLGPRARAFHDHELSERQFRGENWNSICNDIIKNLPEQVWITLDIDGLDPKLCPHTGTPVPGGLGFNQIDFLLSELSRSRKKIIGFDLCEVSPGPKDNEWDANVGMRILFKLSAYALKSQGFI